MPEPTTRKGHVVGVESRGETHVAVVAFDDGSTARIEAPHQALIEAGFDEVSIGPGFPVTSVDDDGDPM